MNYGVMFKGAGCEAVIFQSKEDRTLAIDLALSELGGYEQFEEFETNNEPTHKGYLDWFNS